mmetsp:Transcript_2858/g.6580  ORF Transcript_2858/g.6580 Transcript_2858/m.6580 type:complete len:404 (-) Transcript_2858:46-1257(-)
MDIFDLQSCVAQCCQPQTAVDQPIVSRQVQGGELLHRQEDFPDFSKLRLGAIALRQANDGWKGKNPVCITSIKEGKPHSITHCNNAFVKMIRLKRKDFLRKPIGILFGNATDKNMSSKLLRHLSTGTIGANMTMIVYPFPQDGEAHAARKWVEVDCRPLKDWVGAHAFNKIRFQVGESVRQDIVWYWESRNQFANFNEISAFEEATDRAEKYGGGSNRASRILQSNQYMQQSGENWQDQDPCVHRHGSTTMTIKSPSGERTRVLRAPPKVPPKDHVTQDLDSQALPDGVLRSIVRSPFPLDDANARLSTNFQFNRTRVERERLEQAFLANPDPKLLSDMRKLKESIQKVDGNFVTASGNLRALQMELAEQESEVRRRNKEANELEEEEKNQSKKGKSPNVAKK